MVECFQEGNDFFAIGRQRSQTGARCYGHWRAVLKATADLAGTVAASDAFFPFRDGLDAIAEAGATAVVQPGGSKRDDEVVAAANEHGLAMVLTGRRHFWH